MKKIILSIFLLMIWMPVIAQQTELPPVLKDVKYVKDGTSDQTLDFYWTKQKPSATILFIHGGGLQEIGERRTSAAYRDVCQPFIAAGYGCATMDYRLAPTHKWDAMPRDVASAIVAVRQLISERGGDADRLFLFGHSSGCQLAAIVGADSKYLQGVGLTQRNLAGVIPMGCVLDRWDATLRGVTADSIRERFAKDSLETERYASAEDLLGANPSRHLSPQMPPTLVLVADDERFMPPVLEQGARFVRRLLEMKVKASLVIVPGTHMSSISEIGQPNSQTFAAIQAFITLTSSAKTDLASTIGVPKGSSVTIDGKINEDEWKDALSQDLKNGGQVKIKHDGEFLQIGLQGGKPGLSHVYLNDGKDVFVFHASAALGMVTYQKSGEVWNTTQKFKWELRDQATNSEGSSAYLKTNGWLASVSPMTANDREYKVSMKFKGSDNFRLVAVYFNNPTSPQVFPNTIADDTLNSRLLFGSEPTNLSFKFEQWVMLKLKDK